MMNKQLFYLAFATLFMACNSSEKHLFTLLDSKQTGIDFQNTITESDSLNIFNSEFLYNGGGVGVGDINGDGLQDLFFTGNQVPNKLYLNKGNLKFEDITEKANVQKQPNQWSQGINFLDINRDGKMDIYVCNTFMNNPELRKNQLFINQGNSTEGVPKFAESAAAYGIADTTHAANAQFFDYDNDGDLDLFVAVNFMDTKYPNQYFPKVIDGTSPNRDRLLRNDWNSTLNHPVFTDVSLKAGIKLSGYSHSSLICDFNEDGWQDIYVANDYVTNDLIYINQKNGTFKNELKDIFKHQSASAMGSDVADMNNDGKLDFFTTEMLPYHNKRKKVFLNANNYTTYVNNDSYGYEYQYARNTLQLNRGLSPETGLPVFSDVAFLGDVQETEWSWTPLLADFDNDGKRDIFVTNGFPRDVTDHDFGAYRSTVSYLMSELDLQKTIPQIKVPKFIFKNEGDVHFTDYSKAWGVDKIAFSNGAAYADLDNDGDLDLIVNNLNDNAFLFQNTLNDDKNEKKPNFIRFKVEGTAKNSDAFGTTVTAFFDGQQQAAVIESARGYASTSENIVHFGLGTATKVDSVIVHWSQGMTLVMNNLEINKTINCSMDDIRAQTWNNRGGNQPPRISVSVPAFFETVKPADFGLNFMHEENDFVDFNFQKTIPHKFSQYGPSLSVGDVNGDGLEDFYIGGSAKFDGTWFIQGKDSRFTQKKIAYKTDPQKQEEELGTLLFDADNDGDLDLYIVRGSGQYVANSPFYQDVLCVNDGKGNFKIADNALPKETACGQVVKAVDFDSDGDLDVFVGGRVLPQSYPKTDRSFLLRNDSKEKDKPVFTDVTAEICPELANIGMINDAIFSDFNGDNQPDLILAGEWMPLTFFQNEGGKFKNTTNQTGISDKLGWWTSLTAGDFDNDGDIDYIAGNFGQNLYYKCPLKEDKSTSGKPAEIRNPISEIVYPLSIYAKDFDKNGLYDPFISTYWRDTTGKRQEFFYPTRDDMIKQLVLIRRKFQTYGAFGTATVKNVFSTEELKDAQIMTSNWLYSSYIENTANGKFKMSALPYQAQIAPIYGMMPYDYDADGLLDVMMVGNDYGMELLQGRADGFNGLVLKNMGKNGGKNTFKAVELNESGIYVPNDAKALSRVHLANQKELILATQNHGALTVFLPKTAVSKVVYPQRNEVKTEIVLKNGQKRMQEFYWGHSFLSQYPLSILLDASVQEVRFLDKKNGVVRTVNNQVIQ
jgi:enediyne biosynthesis protein E4